MKPKMPARKPTLTLSPLTVELMNDFDRYSNGFTAMTIADVGAEVTEDGEKIGSIYGAIGGGIVVSIGKVTWKMNMKDLFHAVLEAHREQYK